MTVTGVAAMTVGAAAVAAGGRRRSNGPFEIKDLQNPDPERSRGSRARLARPGAGCLAPAGSGQGAIRTVLPGSRPASASW